MLLLPLLLLLVAVADVGLARVHYALAEDFYAFPKYRVSFLNGLPVLNDTAQRWLAEGLEGGELEFLDQPFNVQMHPSPNLIRTIAAHRGNDDNDDDDDEFQHPLEVSYVRSHSTTPSVVFSHHLPTDVGNHDAHSAFTLQQMKLSENALYICLVPPPVEAPVHAADEHKQEESSPAQSWSLLQPLSGSCLYHRQGWFTYSYCHNNAVRQFREMAHSHPHPPGGYVPEEDPEWEAYTLGQSTSARDEGRDLVVNQHQAAYQNNVDIVASAGHRYLKQTWGDGTICDKTGGPREIEVQFHCSMTMTDTILFVKETKTCHYVMVIHTPRLCGEPGFKTRLEQREEAFIRCRKVVDSPDALAAAKGTLQESAYPTERRERSGVIKPPPRPGSKDFREVSGGTGAESADDTILDNFLKAFGARTGSGAGDSASGGPLAEKIRLAQQRAQARKAQLAQSGGQGADGGQQLEAGDPDLDAASFKIDGEEGEVIIEFVDAEELLDGANHGAGTLEDRLANILSGRLQEALRAAGVEVFAVSEPEDDDEQAERSG